jgi:hypothetical protein
MEPLLDSSLGFDAQIGSRKLSAPYFKRWPFEELFDVPVMSADFRAQTFMLTLC